MTVHVGIAVLGTDMLKLMKQDLPGVNPTAYLQINW